MHVRTLEAGPRCVADHLAVEHRQLERAGTVRREARLVRQRAHLVGHRTHLGEGRKHDIDLVVSHSTYVRGRAHGLRDQVQLGGAQNPDQDFLCDVEP